MTPEAVKFLDKAKLLLVGAAAMLNAGFVEAAGRDTYLAGYHAAQSYIVVVNGKSAKTHDGVKSEFSRLAKDDPRVPHDYGPFCSTPLASKKLPTTNWDRSICQRSASRTRLERRRGFSISS